MALQIHDHIYKYHKNGNASSYYEISDIEQGTTVAYYGYLNSEGGWIIQKWDMSASPQTYRYAAGQTPTYATNWTNRASLTYGYFNEI